MEEGGGRLGSNLALVLTTMGFVAEACCCWLRPAAAVVPGICSFDWGSVVLLSGRAAEDLLHFAEICCVCEIWCHVRESAALWQKIGRVFHSVILDWLVVFCKQMRFTENVYSRDMILQNMHVVGFTCSALFYDFEMLLLWDKGK